jgi:lantibiotic biosynthesis protein
MNFKPSPHIIFRTPRLPLKHSFTDFKPDDLLDDPSFREAIYLASPVLHAECLKYKEGLIKDPKEAQKLRSSLLKYLLRMSSRCTPFGLFSGCSVAQWSDNENNPILLQGPNRIKRNTRFDMHYLCALAQYLVNCSGIKEHLLFYVNSSMYRIGTEWRYVEYQYIDGKRNHHISSVLSSPYLDKVIQEARNGVDFQQLLASLSGDDITEDEALLFINELIQSHILVSELEPAITGQEFIYQLMKVLKRIYTDHQNEGVAEIINILQQADTLLQQADANMNNDATIYKQITGLLSSLEVPFDESRLFQADAVKQPLKAELDENIQIQMDEVLDVFNLLTPVAENENLKKFAGRFYERYEDREMSLPEVLDTETGIGYLENNSADITPLVDGLYMPGPKQKEHLLKWGMTEKFLIEKLNACIKDPHPIIHINEDEIKTLKKNYDLQENWNDLPPSFSVMFRLVDNAEDTGSSLLIENAGGSSAANLLGRFAHTDEKILELVNNITKAEQLQNPDVIFAEIVHLPESRVGNILLHPSFREYEIPYLSKSSLNIENQITLQDLLISVKGGKISLRSKKLNKQIIPRLSTAHNFSYNAQPVYQFLCDLQIQGLRAGLYFSWGSLELQHKFLPRVLYKDVVLSVARWALQKKDYEYLLSTAQDERMGKIKLFTVQWNLPQYTVLADGDNELLIDWQNPEHIEVLLEAIKNRSGIQLKEFLFDTKGRVVDESGAIYNAQFIASFTKTTATYTGNNVQPEANEKETATRKFEPGTEWLYYKLYCGVKTADKILEEVINPLIETLLKEKLIDKWFFIRYTDPHFHLRIRFYVTDLQNLGKVMLLFRQSIDPFINDEFIWKCQVDTYVRELERYSNNSIEEAETLFYHDSAAVLQMLALTGGDEREELRWLWAMRNVDEWMNAFHFNLTEKIQLLDVLKTGFAAEFQVGKTSQHQLSDLYRKHKPAIEKIMNPINDETSEIKPLLDILTERTAKMDSITQKMIALKEENKPEHNLQHMMCSYIHMLLNRICTSKARMQEMVIYDFLHRFYKSQEARTKTVTIKKDQLEQVLH